MDDDNDSIVWMEETLRRLFLLNRTFTTPEHMAESSNDDHFVRHSAAEGWPPWNVQGKQWSIAERAAHICLNFFHDVLLGSFPIKQSTLP